MLRLVLILSIFSLLFTEASASPPPTLERLRLVVLTDIGSLTSGIAEPDDGQSLIRLMLYTNDFDIEGLIATSNLQHGQKVRPDLIRRVVDTYSAVQPRLSTHDDRYPPASRLAQIIKAGQPVAGPKVQVMQSIGDGKDTEGSNWLITVVDGSDSRPVWVVIWGGSADLAQALWRVRNDRSAVEVASFLSKLRIHTIHDQDSTGPWIRENFPDLYVIKSERTYRGMYRGGNLELTSSAWVKAHIHGHGPLGDLYPDYNGGDIWSNKLGRVRGIKEGDTPSFLSLIPNGLSDPKRPWLGSWGGRFEGKENRLTDVADGDVDTSGDPDPRMVATYRWRPAFQADFQARLDWCVKSYAGANHPPIVRIQGERERVGEAGSEILLDASSSVDPDGNALRFAWSIYPPKIGDHQDARIENPVAKRTRLLIPAEPMQRTIPVLLTVTDDGNPALTRYGRIHVSVSNK